LLLIKHYKDKEIENLKKESQALRELYQYAGTPEYSEKVFDKVNIYI